MHKVTIIGTGFGAKVHLPAWQSLPGVKVLGLCGDDYNKTKAIAEAHSVPKAYRTWREAVCDPEVDIVSIALPHFLHAPVALAAIKNKKSFILEKPAGRNLAEAAKIAAAAARGKIPHAVNFELHSEPHFRYAKELLRKNAIGNLRAVDIRLVTGGRARQNSLITWSNYKKNGGGVLLNYGSHVLDYVRWLVGEPKKVTARLMIRKSYPQRQNLPPADTEDTVELGLETNQGVPIRVFITTVVYAGCGQIIEIYGDQGTLCIKNPNLKNFIDGFQLLITDKTRDRFLECKIPKRFGLLTAPPSADGRLPAVRALWQNFLTELRTGKVLTPKLDDALAVQRIIAAARRSDRGHSWQIV